MTAEKYVNAIIKKVKCGRSRKNEIRKQLLTDIREQIRLGESLEKIMEQMGTAMEIAEGFNETIPLKEQKQYTRNKVLKIAIPVLAALSVIIYFIYWSLPKGLDIGKSKYFKQEQVAGAMEETINWINAADYDSLQENAIDLMKPFLTKEQMSAAKNMVSNDWGQFRYFGPAYIMELSQAGTHSAVGEMTVTYENVSVTFRLTYDQDMKLSGIYMR